MRIKNILITDLVVKQVIFRVLLCVGGVLFVSAVSAEDDAARKFMPGVYSGLMLAVDSDGVLQGRFNQSLGSADVSCTFFIKGNANSGQANVLTWSDDVFPGVLTVKDKNRLNLKIEHGPDHPGCGMVLLPKISDRGITLTRSIETNWISLKLVKLDRANLYSGPSLSKKTKSYFIKHDVLGVLSVDGEWVQVEYPREGKKPVKGWMQMRDLADIEPPKNGQSAP